MEYLQIQQSQQKFNFDKKINEFSENKLDYIENFFTEKYKKKSLIPLNFIIKESILEKKINRFLKN